MASGLSAALSDKELEGSSRSSITLPEKELERSATSSVTGPPSVKDKNEEGGVQTAPKGLEETSGEDEGEYPSGFALAMIVTALMLSIFLVGSTVHPLTMHILT